MLTLCRRSAPLPLKVDGFSMGAVMGYSEQHTLLLMTTDEEVDTFLNVSLFACRIQLVQLLILHTLQHHWCRTAAEHFSTTVTGMHVQVSAAEPQQSHDLCFRRAIF